MDIIINADDLGISPGVNWAIEELVAVKALTHASWMVNTDFFEEANEKVVKIYPDFNIGLHLNLTYSHSVSRHEDIPLLTDEIGKFKNSFSDLLKLNFIQKTKFYKQVKTELESQLQKALDCRSNLSHIDGHWHVQMIPAVFQAVQEMLGKYKIPRVRIINESFFRSMVTIGEMKIFHPQKIAKHILMKYLKKINKIEADYYLYSFLFSSEMKKKYFDNISLSNKYKTVEIMVHPGNTEIDKQVDVRDEIVNNFIKSEFRDIELETCKIIKDRLWQ